MEYLILVSGPYPRVIAGAFLLGVRCLGSKLLCCCLRPQGLGYNCDATRLHPNQAEGKDRSLPERGLTGLCIGLRYGFGWLRTWKTTHCQTTYMALRGGVSQGINVTTGSNPLFVASRFVVSLSCTLGMDSGSLKFEASEKYQCRNGALNTANALKRGSYRSQSPMLVVYTVLVPSVEHAARPHATAA